MIAKGFNDYEIIATGGGEKLERWGDVILLRPDPQIIWPASFNLSKYKDLAAIYRRSDKGGGGWDYLKKVPDEWVIGYNNLRFSLKLMGFKHVGLFPEQAVNWQLMTDLIKADLSNSLNSISLGPNDLNITNQNAANSVNIKSAVENAANSTNIKSVVENAANINKPNLIAEKPNKSPLNNANLTILPKEIKVLNLFAYTGGASVACAAAGARVTHVDAAKGMVDRAKLNADLSKADGIRYIVDDCAKFVSREIKRESYYDAVIMDPPSYGRGPSGEIWKIEDSLFDLVSLTAKVLKPNPLFVLINSYTTGLQPTVIENILNICLKSFKGKAMGYEVCLPTNEGIPLPCGCSGLWKRAE